MYLNVYLISSGLVWQRKKSVINNLSMDFDKFKVGSVPTLMYIPDFITHHQQTLLLNNVRDTDTDPLVPFSFKISNHLACFSLMAFQINGAPLSKWKSLKNRRLQNWGLYSSPF